MADPAPVTGVGPPGGVVERAGGVHFPGLDAYRAIGMTMVLLNHAAYSTGYISQNDDAGGLRELVADVVARFDISVPMFFVMSGFLLYRPFATAALGTGRTPRLRTFYQRRALHIVPGYWAALAGLAVLAALTPAFDLGIDGVGAWIGNLLALPAFGVPVETCSGDSCHVGYGITQAWSIGVEITFYLLLPLYAAGIARLAGWRPGGAATRPGVLVAGTAALWATGTAFRVLVVVIEPSWARQSLLWLPMFLDLFAIGMALSLLSARYGADGPPGLVARLAAHPAACWVAAAAVLGIMTRFSPPDEPFGLNGAEYLPRQLLYGLASALWLLPAMFGDQTRGRLRAVLASRPLVYLGAISLSFYLWHLALIAVAKSWTVPGYDELVAIAADPPPGNALAGVATFTGSFPLVAAIAWVLAVAVASAAFRLVELPFLRRKAPARARSAEADPAGPPATDGRPT